MRKQSGLSAINISASIYCKAAVADDLILNKDKK